MRGGVAGQRLIWAADVLCSADGEHGYLLPVYPVRLTCRPMSHLAANLVGSGRLVSYRAGDQLSFQRQGAQFERAMN